MQSLTDQFIDNRWIPSTETTTQAVTQPYDESLIAQVTRGSADDVDAAVAAARKALPAWRAHSGQDRAVMLDRIADQLAARREHLVRLISFNGGKPLAEAEMDVDDATACYRYYAGLARELDARQGAELPATDPALVHRAYQDPVGVVGLITPWNFPLVTSAWKIAPALAAGCTIVFKPSEVTPLPEREMAEIALAAGLPAGVFNLLHGDGHLGAALTAHPGIDKLSFTGSNPVGVRVMQSAAEGARNLSLELGGKSPIIVTADADPAQAAELILAGFCFNAGQMCSATTRLLLHRNCRDQVLAALKSAIGELVMGDPQHPDTTLGPLINALQYERVQGFLTLARNDGLQPLIDPAGQRVPEQGYFVAPQVYLDVPVTHRLWREEIFGPVLCVRTVDSDEEAIALANDSDYGLAATVVSGALSHAAELANQLQAGHIWCNTYQIAPPSTSWGGMKRSSLGRELGPAGLESYLEKRVVTLPA